MQTMTKYKVEEIKPDTHFKHDVVLDPLFLIAAPPSPITEDLLKILNKWGFADVSCDEELNAAPINNPAEADEDEKTEEVEISDFIDEKDEPEPPKEVPEELKNTEEVDVSQFESAPPAASADTEEGDKALLEEAQKLYDDLIEFTEYIYTMYSTQKKLPHPEINEKVLALCNFIRDHRPYILRVSPRYDNDDKKFLVRHNVRTAIFSIIIGFQLKLSFPRLIDLGTTALLHEIGQLRLPPNLYMKDGVLSPAERAKVQTHTALGYSIVKEAGFPPDIQMGILDHHEREDGSGYPRKLTSERISTYGKIIGVACPFAAMGEPRNFKKPVGTYKTPYDSVLEMLKDKRRYNASVLQALLLGVSLYPIGSFVILSNRKIGQVVDVVASDLENPIIYVPGEKNPDGTMKRVQSGKDFTIVRAATNKETEALRRVIAQKAKQ